MEYVYASDKTWENKGIPMRDYIATEALKSLISAAYGNETNPKIFTLTTKQLIAETAYLFADAMMIQKDK